MLPLKIRCLTLSFLIQELDKYTLIVQGVDMDGAPNGNTGTGTVEIKVLDINDNVPTLEKDAVTN